MGATGGANTHHLSRRGRGRASLRSKLKTPANQPRQGNRNSKCPLGDNNEAAPDAGPLFFLCISCGRRTQPNPARVLCYFFFDLAFFFMTLFLAVGPSPDRKDGVGQMNAA